MKSDFNNQPDRKFRNGIRLIAVALIIQSILILYLIHNLNNNENVVYTKKIIVMDDNNNPRIVISPQIDSIENRIRNDKVNGILFLNEKGQDQLTLGINSKVMIKNKLVERAGNDNPLGLMINDENGNERAGIGFFSKRKVTILGMDGVDGQEGLYLFLADKELMGQKVGLYMGDKNSQQILYLGRSIKNESILNLDAPEKARLSFSLDSSGNNTLKKFNYKTGEVNEILMK